MGPGYVLVHSCREQWHVGEACDPLLQNYIQQWSIHAGKASPSFRYYKSRTLYFIHFPYVPLQVDLCLLYSKVMTCKKLPSPSKTAKPSHMFSKWGFLAFSPWGNTACWVCTCAQSLSLSATTHTSTSELVSGLNYILQRATAFKDIKSLYRFCGQLIG